MESRESARELVRSIARGRGYLSEEILERMDQDTRREVEEAMLKKDEMIGSSVLTLAKDVYNSSARFVFELLQNADDNSYSKAKSRSEAPYVSYRVYPRQIVFECNEDGFTPEDLIAICNIGKSSKTSVQGEIGEKDIGFKSVFMVAWKVLIQSGELSFYLQHRIGDSGMGMISPTWQEREEEVPNDITRITLFLHETGPEEILAKQRETTRQQFQELQATFLLFMKNIERIDVAFYDDESKETCSMLYSLEYLCKSRGKLVDEKRENGHIHVDTRHYHITKITLDKLPFLIHADFDTDASRQDIPLSSTRNTTLLSYVGLVLATAVQEFCQHPTLHAHIHAHLNMSDVLWTRTHSELHSIIRTRRLPSSMLDSNGDPLLRDLKPEQYLSPKYRPRDLNLLTGYGLVYMSNYGFLERVRQDLSRDDSLIRSSSVKDDDWHSRVTRVLMSAYQERPKSVSALAIIPLTNGEWRSSTSIKAHRIYHSHCNGYLIPEVNIRLVDPRAEKNPDRERLFSQLGVKNPKISRVRDAIIRTNYNKTVDLDVSRAQLEFLYLTVHLDRRNDSAHFYSDIDLIDQQNRYREPDSHTFYFPGKDLYSAEQLLTPTKPAGTGKSSRPSVYILHSRYMEPRPIKPIGERRTWMTWLSESLQVRNTIPITDSTRLSPECTFIAEHHPEKLVGFLVKNWKFDAALLEKQKLVDKLLKLQVVCESGSSYCLGETYVPVPELSYLRQFLRNEDDFPWLKIDNTWLSELNDMAKALGFGFPKSELEAYLRALQSIKESSDGNDATLNETERVYDLYARIQAQYSETSTPDYCRSLLRTAFASQNLIYVPNIHDEAERPCWESSGNCLREAPQSMECKIPLKWKYNDVKHGSCLAKLFNKTLGIPNVGLNDLLKELNSLSAKGCDKVDRILILYREIDKCRPKMNKETTEKVRRNFEMRKLIYSNGKATGEWHSPSQCLWSTVTNTRGIVTLKDLYKDLQDFFVELLGVPTLTAEMVYSKLLEQGRGMTPINEVKDTIWLLNSYLQSEEDPPSSTSLLESRVFLVRYPNGVVELRSSTVDFTISDRKHLSQYFFDKALFLDFSTEVVLQLEPFIEWAKIETRYLSSCVKEISCYTGDSYRSLTSPDRKLSQKAYGLLRIAVHYKSPRLADGERAFYDLLKNIDVRETDGITSELHLQQDGKEIKAKVSEGEIHIEEITDGLHIYVPWDAKAQYICFLDRIHKDLLEWILTEPSTAIFKPYSEKALTLMKTILQAPVEYVSLILDRAGIVPIETPEDLSGVDVDASNPTDQTSVENSHAIRGSSCRSDSISACDANDTIANELSDDGHEAQDLGEQ
ncbi:hypothetical protein ASPFODRAFT_57246 [Aspergillus luchuensis CBS 106.47]|uniref:Uncharacterized protein n=1 Tax=Aspergillus luchuensis (strain CBS 106.47) TaxID=1137211 RepID=A0A1M3TW23_ASPLC|nr:hypothetical protein ASPFODRAFT_57246 [Aspergillus luchuensis CBS 106.47]